MMAVYSLFLKGTLVALSEFRGELGRQVTGRVPGEEFGDSPHGRRPERHAGLGHAHRAERQNVEEPMKAVPKINRFTLALGAALALSVIPAAYAADGEYGVLMKTLANPFWGAMQQGVEAAAKEAGVKIFLQAAESDQAA